MLCDAPLLGRRRDLTLQGAQDVVSNGIRRAKSAQRLTGCSLYRLKRPSVSIVTYGSERPK